MAPETKDAVLATTTGHAASNLVAGRDDSGRRFGGARATKPGASRLLAFTMAFAAMAAAAAGMPADIPVEAFFAAPDIDAPRLSPSGDALAVLVPTKAGRQQLVILDTADPKKVSVAANFDGADIDGVQWVTDKRLVFRLRYGRDAVLGNQGSGLFAVDRDGGEPRGLVLMRGQWRVGQGNMSKVRPLTADHDFVRTLDDGSADVIVQRTVHNGLTAGTEWQIDGSTPLRLDTRTGRVTEIVKGHPPEHVMQWAVDGLGEPRAAFVQDGKETDAYVPDGTGPWKRLVRLPSSAAKPMPYDFSRAGVDGNVYLARATSGDDARVALHRIGVSASAPDVVPLVSLKGFDFSGDLVEDAGHHRLLGVHYETDAEGTAWFDADMKAIQAKVDAQLPGRVNRIDVARCGCASRVLVTSYSDHEPSAFALYAPASDTWTPLGRARSAIDPKQMSDTDFVRIHARDGADLPLYVTKPQGKGPWPAVVLVHAGPWLRGSRWEWDAEAQFLASRGYLVVKPEYRGSAGYGQSLFQAGFRQWGAKMQDDLADATRRAASAGLADAARTCIAGDQFGGYAALLAVERDGALYRCGLARAAWTDASRIANITWDDAGDVERAYGVATLVGAADGTSAALAVPSPIDGAGRISRPLLLAFGTDDTRAPIAAAARFHAALDVAKERLTWIEYPGESQGFELPASRFDYYRQVERFLAANIGSAGAAGSGER